jgi:hypothetical protein
MPKPISRKDLIRRLKVLGWVGPFPGKNHMHMENHGRRLPIPNPHGNDLDWTLTKRIIKQAGISQEDWDALG